MRSLLPLLLLALTTCATTPGLESAAPRPSEVRPRFDWAAGGEAQVRAHRVATDVSPKGRFVDEAKLSYRLRVSESDEGVLLRWDQAEVEALPERWIPRTAEMVATEIGQADFLVSRLGNFAGLSAPAEAQSRVAAWAVRTIPKEPAPSGVHARLVALFSEDALAQRTADFWLSLVDVWNGGAMELGAPYRAKDTLRVAGLGGIPVMMDVEIRAREWVACGPGDRAASCVRLELSARPAAEQRPLLMEFTANFFDADPDRELTVEHDVEVITEPRGLRPHALRARERVEIPLASGEAVVIADERRLVFDWATAPALEPGID